MRRRLNRWGQEVIEAGFHGLNLQALSGPNPWNGLGRMAATLIFFGENKQDRSTIRNTKAPGKELRLYQ
jgi:hypothetical protein